MSDQGTQLNLDDALYIESHPEVETDWDDSSTDDSSSSTTDSDKGD